MFELQPIVSTLDRLPYRARYQVSFEGSQPELKSLLLDLLENLDAIFLDNEEKIRLNPIDNRYELEAVLTADLEFDLLIYWSSDDRVPIKVTFDLDSPEPLEIPIDGLFFTPAQAFFPTIRQVYNFLHKQKITTTKIQETSDFPANRQWLKEHRLQYLGKWVALQGGHLLAEAPSANELIDKLESIQHVLLTAVY